MRIFGREENYLGYLIERETIYYLGYLLEERDTTNHADSQAVEEYICLVESRRWKRRGKGMICKGKERGKTGKASEKGGRINGTQREKRRKRDKAKGKRESKRIGKYTVIG